MNDKFLETLDEYIKQRKYRLVNSVLVYRADELIFERYYNTFNQESRNNIKSIWKSILSICVGICIDRGMIKGTDDFVMDYIDEFSQNIHPYHKLIRIHHLLTMSSGIYWNPGIHYHCPMFEQLKSSRNWIGHISDVAMASVPGTNYVYKEWDVILLSEVIKRAAGKSPYEICREFLYEPLGIKSGVWPQSPCGVCYTITDGEEDSDLSARDLAKIGQLFMNGGNYKGEKIVSGGYVKQALTPSCCNKGYGYLWWLFGNHYGCRGFGGQEINVYPQEELITVIQATPTPSGKEYGDITKRIFGENDTGNL